MAWSEIKMKAAPELHRQLAALREELRDARFRVNQGQLKNVRHVRSLKRDIARHLTKLQHLSVTKNSAVTKKSA